MKRLGVFIAILLVCAITVHSKVFVLSVGIADYPGTGKDLRISDNDAKTIAKVFNATNDASVKILVNSEATQSALLGTMSSLFSGAQSDDAVILYFSGHGSSGALICHDGSLTYQRIFKVLRNCKANRKIIIADACFSGRMRTSRQESTNYNAHNVMLFLSSRTDEVSRETKYKNSLFTIFLERGLRGGADCNKDRRITAREIYDFVHQGVVEASEGKQHPVMWGNFDSNMTLIKW